jgi:hypothetical protein
VHVGVDRRDRRQIQHSTATSSRRTTSSRYDVDHTSAIRRRQRTS